MTHPFDDLYATIKARAESYGIRVAEEPQEEDVPGRFDGVSATMNPRYDREQRCYYLVHALGSMVEWGLRHRQVQALFDELRSAKEDRRDRERLDRAIEAYRAFEVKSSEYAVWLLAELGHAADIPAYTNFARADLEAMTLSHRTGELPRWPDFFAAWNREVARGERTVEPYRPRPVPPFRPAKIKTQEIVQEHDE